MNGKLLAYLACFFFVLNLLLGIGCIYYDYTNVMGYLNLLAAAILLKQTLDYYRT